MKKISVYLTLFVAGLLSTACHEDFDDWAQPQSFAQPEAITIPGFTASTAGNVDLNTADNLVQLVSLSQAALPAGSTIEKLRFTTTDGQTISAASADGLFAKSDLQQLVVGLFGPAPSARQIGANVYADVMVGGQAAYVDAGTVTLSITPEAPYIAPAYYIIGGPNDWEASAASKPIKFQHSGANVYDDPVFTVVFDAAKSGDTWFAIGDDQGCDAIANGDWTRLFGVVGGNSQATEGSLDYRYNLGGDNSFCVAGGAKRIKVTINMLERTYTVTPINVADNYYIVGGLLDWAASAASKEQKFSHSDASVADDPVFTYVFEGNGGDIWFAIADDEACDAIANDGDWSKLYGTTLGNGNNGLSGSLTRRSALTDEGSFKVDGTSKYIRVEVNMAELTYTITPLNFTEYLWEAGVNNDWGAVAQPLYSPGGTGVYTGFFYAQDADWSDGKGAFKFTGAFNDWSKGNYGSGTSSDQGGTIIDSGESGNLFATPGFYRAEVNLQTMSYTLTPISGIGIIGPAQPGGWDTDTDMTYNPATRAWEATVTLAADELKFRANDAWDINWGGSLDNLVQNGANLKVEKAGKYFVQFFPLCETKSYATITPAE